MLQRVAVQCISIYLHAETGAGRHEHMTAFDDEPGNEKAGVPKPRTGLVPRQLTIWRGCGEMKLGRCGDAQVDYASMPDGQVSRVGRRGLIAPRKEALSVTVYIETSGRSGR